MADEIDMVDRYCEVMHDAYETAAIAVGWETQERSRVPWADVPAANKATMRVAVAALLEEVLGDVSRRIDTTQRAVVRDVGRERGSQMAGLEHAQYVVQGMRDEILG